MEILTFDICGKFAHFRKYYANNTAMTFSLPPRTTIIGIIAGAMGLPKDSYYEDLNSNNIRIGINILTEIKKTFHRVNLLMIKGSSDFRGRKGRIQTPFEIVSGIDPKRDFVKYRIFISANDVGKAFFDRIKDTFLNNQFVYNPTLGTANFSANIENIQFYSDSDSKEINTGDEFIDLNSACLSENIANLLFEKDETHFYNLIEEELMPADFISNNNRELNKMNRILFSSGNIPLKVKLKSPVYKITKNGNTQTIQFLD
jgi:CRISPR-associated protein Cas5h